MRVIAILLSCSFYFPALVQAQNGLHLDGVDDYVQAPQPGPLGAASRTVEAWVKQDAVSAQQRVVLDWGEMPNGNRFTLNIINALPRIEVGGYGISSTTPMVMGAWYHLAATFNSTANPKLKLYVNGAMVASGNPTQTVNTSNMNGIIVGRRNDMINHFNGTIDDVRVWNVARSAAEINAYKGRSFCVPPASLVAYYKCDQGLAGGFNGGVVTLNDASASANAGTLYSFTLSGNTSNWVAGQVIQTTVSTTSNVSTCDPYTSPSGTTYATSGTYIENLISASTGCDSISTINVTIAPIDTTVTASGYTLTAQMIGAQYQWLDCDNGYSPIPGSIGQNFTPGYSSSYAVRLTTTGCVDTSGCWTITGVGLNEQLPTDAVTVGPNPTDGSVAVRVAGFGSWTMRMLDAQGREVVAARRVHEASSTMDLSTLPAGMYVVEVERNGARSRHRVVRR
ncbi:MAG: T9SS type A sorting domain-containing protein [Flavobacteriales bacterium]|nr:T9SS type A sorting domain-containing protein [Flavobacteriales bacterium]